MKFIIKKYFQLYFDETIYGMNLKYKNLKFYIKINISGSFKKNLKRNTALNTLIYVLVSKV